MSVLASICPSSISASDTQALTFTVIAATDRFSSLGNPVISDRGIVAFWGVRIASCSAAINPNSGIFASDGEEIITLADTSLSFSLFARTPSINDQNTVVFNANLDSIGSGIFTVQAGEITSIAESPFPRGAFGEAVINNQGTVVFPVYANALNPVGNAILMSKEGVTSTLVDGRDAFRSFEEVDLNDEDAIAFSAILDDGDRGIYIRQANQILPVATTNDSFSFLANPVINNLNTVAFNGTLDDPAIEGIYVVSEGATETLADNQGAFSFFENPSLNDLNRLAFKAVLDDGEIGIFTGADPIADKVIAVGDRLAGSTVTNLFISNDALNNRNQLVFYAQLLDGNSGIFRVDLSG